MRDLYEFSCKLRQELAGAKNRTVSLFLGTSYKALVGSQKSSLCQDFRSGGDFPVTRQGVINRLRIAILIRPASRLQVLQLSDAATKFSI